MTKLIPLCLGLFGLLKASSSPSARLLVLLLHLLYRFKHRGVPEHVGQYNELDVAAPEVYLLQLAHTPISPRQRHWTTILIQGGNEMQLERTNVSEHKSPACKPLRKRVEGSYVTKTKCC